jgi:hypothetical protein
MPQPTPVSQPTPVTPAIIDTILGHLAPHFLTAANGDLTAARYAASRMLACHNAKTEEELHLATDIVSFGFHALEALSVAAAPDLSLNQKLRLRGSAVSMSREAHKARRKLDQLKRASLTASPQPEAAPEARPPASPPAAPATSKLLDPINHAARFSANNATPSTRPHPQRLAAERIAENLRRNKAEHGRHEAAMTGNPGVEARAPAERAA